VSNLDNAVGSIIMLHLTNGMPLMAKLASYDEDSNTVILNKAMEVNFVQNPRDPRQIAVQFLPAFTFANPVTGPLLPVIDNLPLSLADVLLVRDGAQVPKQIEDGYLQATSGVVIANEAQAKAQGLKLVTP